MCGPARAAFSCVGAAPLYYTTPARPATMGRMRAVGTLERESSPLTVHMPVARRPDGRGVLACVVNWSSQHAAVPSRDDDRGSECLERVSSRQRRIRGAATRKSRTERGRRGGGCLLSGRDSSSMTSPHESSATHRSSTTGS